MWVGIDLGTTNSTVAAIDDNTGESIVVTNEDGNRFIPSVICFQDDGTVIIGNKAKKMMNEGMKNCVSAFKFGMGDKDTVFSTTNGEYTAEDLSALMIDYLLKNAKANTGVEEITDAVITVPAYFDDLQRKSTIRAAQKNGLNVMRIVNEPTSAAVHYGYRCDKDRTILVYDLGGGTFDATFIKISNGILDVIATGGNSKLGGLEWDKVILRTVADRFKSKYGIDPRKDPSAMGILKTASEECKIALSSDDEYIMDVKIANKNVKYRIKRDWFETNTEFLLKETGSSIEAIMEENGLTWDDVDEILLVGGSVKMPSVQRYVRSISGKPVSIHDDVDDAVALGAATFADMFARANNGMRSIDIADVTSHSLGALCTDIEADCFFNKVIIKRNSKIPAEGLTQFKIVKGNYSKSIDVYILQGDSRNPSDCVVLDHKIVSGFNNLGDGVIIDVHVGYDVNGIVTLRATHDDEELNVQNAKIEGDYSWMSGRISDAPREKDVMPTNIMFCVDVSRSMEKEGALEEAKKCIKNFIRNIDNDDVHFGLIAFGDKSEYICDFDTDISIFCDRLDELKPNMLGRGTDSSPLGMALTNVSDRVGIGIIVIVTDGKWGNAKQAQQQSNLCSERTIPIFAIGLGNVDKIFLDKIANTTEGALFTRISNLDNAFSTIAGAINSGRIGMRSTDV